MARCLDAMSILTWEEDAKRIEGVEVFKYLRRILNRSDDNCPAVIRSIWKARQLWGRLGKFIRREGAGLAESAKFYCALVQAVLLFGEEAWLLSAPMYQKLEGVHVDLMQQVTRKK